MSLAALTPKQRKFVRNRSKGMSRLAAARKAGYSESTALAATRTVETPDVKAVMRSIAQRTVPPKSLVDELVKGIDADTPRVISWGDKLRVLQTVAEWAGYVDKGSNEGSSLHVLALVPKQEQQAQAIDVSTTPAPVPPATT